jgi:hypothetical protein
LQDEFEISSSFLGVNFHHLATKKIKSSATHKNNVLEKNAPKSQFLKLPYLDNRFQQVAKL